MEKFEEIVEGVYLISAGRANAYLLTGEDLSLVDTGMPGEEENVIRGIRKIGRKPGEISHILITHAHMDHMGSLAALKKASGAMVVASGKEVDYVKGVKRTWTMGREGFGGSFSRRRSFLWRPLFLNMSRQMWIFPARVGRPLTVLVASRW